MAKKATPAAKAKRRTPRKQKSAVSGSRKTGSIGSFVNGLELEELNRLVDMAVARRDELRSAARDAFLEEVKNRAANLGVRLTELVGLKPDRGRRATSSGKAGGRRRAKPGIKYRNPETGETWTGLGRTARWLAELEAKGRRREEFAVSRS
jgi:DNA-binding protein H-NS